MKTERQKLLTSESATKNLLWQEIPEDSAETFKGGTRYHPPSGIIFHLSAKKKTGSDPGAGGPIGLDSAFGLTKQ